MGYWDAEQPTDSSQMGISFLRHERIPQIPLWASRPVWFNEVTPKLPVTLRKNPEMPNAPGAIGKRGQWQ